MVLELVELLTFAEISNIIADIAHIGANHNGK